MMRSFRGITAFLKIGASFFVFSSCLKGSENQKTDLNVSSMFYLVNYECDFKEFVGKSNCSLPVDIACYFGFVSRDKDRKIYFSKSWTEFMSNKKSASSVIVSYKSISDSSYFLIPLEEHATLKDGKPEVVPFSLKFGEAQHRRDFFSGQDLMSVNLNARRLSFSVHGVNDWGSQTANFISSDDLHVYFIFNDTTITCTKNNCYPYIDTEYLINESKY